MEQRAIRTVLVASRGEIARRIFRACRELGLISVAIYADPDAGSVWSRKADRSVRLPGVSAAETYLNIPAVIAAAREVGADAIHPGYGFLAENAAFAETCAAAGLVFVGPPPAAMRALGAKVAARQLARAAGVTVVPGYDGPDLSAATLAAEAERIGYPVLVKASAGGGGRGMRLVREPGALADNVAAARAEAASAFGDDRVFLERYFDLAHHVEVQVLGDHHGNVVHLFERECSVQRRHQKIIEESPSPALDPDLLAAMTDAAVRLARQAGYASAGTVEFLLDAAGRWYFLEMNTRLQVEHGVTEMVTDVDIPVCQLRVAGGEALPFRQTDLSRHGHAIECRVYAEDPARGFLPSIGEIVYYRPPAGPGIRCDDGVASGSAVTPHYDALLAKVIAAGLDREEALRRMAQALSDTVVLGVTTNVPYLQAILRHPVFRAGQTFTRFLDDHMAEWVAETDLGDVEWLAAAAFESLSTAAEARAEEEALGLLRFADPWSVTESWRNVR